MNDQESLDPINWQDTSDVGHQMIDDMIDYLKNLRTRPVWQEMSTEDRSHFDGGLPLEERPINEVYSDFQEKILPYVMGNPHPRFWAWYMGSSSMMGSIADFLTSITNSNAGAGNHVGQLIEDQVINWMNEVVGYPSDASGLIVSGGSMANLVGLSVARHKQAGYDIRKEGIRAGQKQMVVYASTEVHSCNQKAIELLGIGSANFRKVGVKEDLTMDIEALKSQIMEDRSQGYQPICIIASAGTVNTGAIDDLEAIADICVAEDLWYHVDGAIGAIAMLSPKVKPLLKGMERSDSVALDLHKWLHIPFEAGCVLVKNRTEHRSTFKITPEYLQRYERGLPSGTNWYSEYGIQLSRRLKALKVWMCIQHQGMLKLGRMITKNVDQAAYLGELIERNEQLELMAPIGLDIVCYRFLTTDLSSDLNDINKEILLRLHEGGYAVPSYTTIEGQYCIRVAIANHRSIKSDFDFLVAKTVDIGNSISRK